MQSSIAHGYLVLADISGYTGFVAQTELDHSQDILRSILSVIIEQLTPTLELAEVEGDAVFVYAPTAKISRGELLLELIEATYLAFREKRRTMEHNSTCPCKACRLIPTLDLKFVTHYGEYVTQNISGRDKPVGSCVNLAHALLKNGVSETTGWRGYALFSGESLEQMKIHPVGSHDGAETYAYLGECNTCSINLDQSYRALIDDRKIYIDAREADLVISYDFPAPPPRVWDWLNDPAKRIISIKGSSWAAKSRPQGRTGPAAENHCATSGIIEQILDWRPFDYFTVRYQMRFFDVLVTGDLEETTAGTRLSWNMKFGGSLLPWLLRAFSGVLAARMRKRVGAYFAVVEQLIADGEMRTDQGCRVRG